MKRPLVLVSGMSGSIDLGPGLTFPTYLNTAWCFEAVEEAGGIPLLAPFLKEEAAIEQLVAAADGIFITGGEDIEPKRYGEEREPFCQDVCLPRDEFEFKVIKHALAMNKPTLCICRGSQLLNVALGGTLYQDIATQAPGSLDHVAYGSLREETAHTVAIEEGSILHKALGKTTLGTNSGHHQAVKDLAPGLTVIAKTEDGIVEATQMNDKRFVLGCQWHPEMIENSEQYHKIFDAFVAACKE